MQLLTNLQISKMIYLNAANMKHLLIGHNDILSYPKSERIKKRRIQKIKWKTKPKSEEEYDMDKPLQSTVPPSTDLFGSKSHPTHRRTGIYLSFIHLFKMCCFAHWNLKKEYLIYIWILRTYKPCKS